MSQYTRELSVLPSGVGEQMTVSVSNDTGCVCVQNGNPQNPYCAGIAGIMDAYHRTLQAVQLYGPTNFSPVINHVARQVFHTYRHFSLPLLH